MTDAQALTFGIKIFLGSGGSTRRGPGIFRFYDPDRVAAVHISPTNSALLVTFQAPPVDPHTPLKALILEVWRQSVSPEAADRPVDPFYCIYSQRKSFLSLIISILARGVERAPDE